LQKRDFSALFSKLKEKHGIHSNDISLDAPNTFFQIEKQLFLLDFASCKEFAEPPSFATICF